MYTKTFWEDGLTPVSAANMNKIEDAVAISEGNNYRSMLEDIEIQSGVDKYLGAGYQQVYFAREFLKIPTVTITIKDIDAIYNITNVTTKGFQYILKQLSTTTSTYVTAVTWATATTNTDVNWIASYDAVTMKGE